MSFTGDLCEREAQRVNKRYISVVNEEGVRGVQASIHGQTTGGWWGYQPSGETPKA